MFANETVGFIEVELLTVDRLGRQSLFWAEVNTGTSRSGWLGLLLSGSPRRDLAVVR